MRTPKLILGISATAAMALLLSPSVASAAPSAPSSPAMTSASETSTSPQARSAASSTLNARAAAMAAGTETAAMVTWYSGTVGPGEYQGWVWNNANPLTAAYQVGFSPAGAATSAACQFEVTRSWYTQLASGERKFHFDIRNVGTIACATTILLGQVESANSWSTGGLNPGASQGWVWNNANPTNASYVVGLSPTGATSTDECQFEVTRTWYEQLSSGERKFHFDVKNVGRIACVADIRLAKSTASSTFATGTLRPGATGAWFWNNANPTTVSYATGLRPSGATSSGSCQLEVTRTFYLQEINSDGSTQRRFYVSVRNIGNVSCSGTVLLANIST